jgi:phosphonate transport system substrate-binding protein
MRAACSRRVFLSALLATGFGARASAIPDDSTQALRFGLTPVVLDDRIAFLDAWADWIESQFGRPVVFVQRSRYREILDLLLQGRSIWPGSAAIPMSGTGLVWS